MRHMLRTLLLVLFVVSLQPATAIAVDGDQETTFMVPLQANHGLSAKLEADDDEIELTLRRKGQLAVYSAPGEVSPEGISVDLGRLGTFDVAYTPSRTLDRREPGRRCEGEPRTTTEGYFRGTLRFRGEGGYVRIKADTAKGTRVLQPEWKCRHRNARTSWARAKQVNEDKATLTADSRRPWIRFGAFASRAEHENPFTYFFAASRETREGVQAMRFTYARTRAAGFRFDHRRGTAIVDPPAPFAGSARYMRRPDARDGWSGSLTAPLLGLGRVHLAGPGFHAWMVPRVRHFE
jgi:hypothetical protein